ncbi:MAG: DUF3833 family protein [Sphingomonadaceae bacterium]|nr:DUF3833 family protein [Sphingomonadaceae bacterium]
MGLRAPAALLLLLLAGCGAPLTQPELERPEPRFDPVAFFSGTSHGEGRLKLVLSPSRTVRVDSAGRFTDGTLVLDQTIRREGHRIQRRSWRLRETAPGHWQGSLTEASGPVTADVSGNALHIRYAMKGGLHAEQWLYLAADGRSAANRLGIRFGPVRLATIEERIEKR